jgi:hypothetical protein
MHFTHLLFAFGIAVGARAQVQTVSINLTALTGVTPISGGTGAFTAFPTDPCISFGNVTFQGQGSGGQTGIYAANLLEGLEAIADTNTLIPGGIGKFVGHPPDPCISGNNVVLRGQGSGGQMGVYVYWARLLVVKKTTESL